MRCRTLLLICLAAVFLFPAGAQTSPAAANASAAARATQSYRYDKLKFTYQYPGDMQLMPRQDIDSAVQAEKDNATNTAQQAVFQCITVPFTAQRDTSDFAMLTLIDMDGDCMGKTFTKSNLPDVVQGALSTSLSRVGTPSVGQSAAYSIGGSDASAIFGTSIYSQNKSIIFYAGATCLLRSNHIVCIEALAERPAVLDLLIADPLQFDGGAAQPMIPAGLAPKP